MFPGLSLQNIFRFYLGFALLPFWVNAVPTAPPSFKIRHTFIWFKMLNAKDELSFGGKSYPLDSPELPGWMLGGPLSDFVGKYRTFGYAAESPDGGQTWYRLNELVPPLKVAGTSQNNGVLHFTTNDKTNLAFVSYIDWDHLHSHIYSVNRSGSQWTYDALGSDFSPPRPVIGDAQRAVNFYSPAIVLNNDAERSMRLYFGGWREKYALGPYAKCPSVDHTKVELPWGESEEVCDCGAKAIDACTGDKIFVATNQSLITKKPDPKFFRVYQKENQWSPDSHQDQLFASIISPAQVNRECGRVDSKRCPFLLVHTNDPTVIRTPKGYVMYFTGAAIARPGGYSFNYTHVARSKDGLKWGDFAILQRGPNTYFPGSLSFNAANGTARAFYDSARDRIVLLSVGDFNDPNLIHFKDKTKRHPDAEGQFVYEIDPQHPEIVISSKRVDRLSYQWVNCQPGEVCGRAQDMSCRFKKIPVTHVLAAEERSGWSVEALKGGGFYSTNEFSKSIPSRPAHVIAWMDKPREISAIRLAVRLNQGKIVGFPPTYRIWITSPDGLTWDKLDDFSLPPTQDGQLSLEMGKITTRGILIEPITLGKDEGGKFYFQLGEISFISTENGCGP